MNTQDLAYVGGLFDGEGYVRIAKNVSRLKPNRNPTYQLYCGINMCDTAGIKFVGSLFAGNLYLTGRRLKPNHRTLYGWIACSQQAATFLRSILPYTKIKTEQIKLALEFQEHIDKSGRSWNRYKRLSPEVIALRESYHVRLRHLKTLSV